MPGFMVHVQGLVTCPHQGPVSAAPTSPRVFLNGAPALTIANVPMVGGCPFQIPTPGGPKPQPCITVRVQASSSVFISGQPAAILTPATLCYSAEQIPQGPPNSVPNQKRVIAR